MRWLWLVTLIGCTRGGQPLDGGPAASDDHQPHGGTRLRPVVESAADAKRIVAWHDTLRDLDCRFVPTAPSEYRCVPAPKAAKPGDLQLTEAACSGAFGPLGSFVAAVAEHDPTGQLWLVAADGTRAPYGAWDG